MFRKRHRKDPAEDLWPKPKRTITMITEVENGLPLPGQPRRSWLPWKKERNY
jgi:hypothetical protein